MKLLASSLLILLVWGVHINPRNAEFLELSGGQFFFLHANTDCVVFHNVTYNILNNDDIGELRGKIEKADRIAEKFLIQTDEDLWSQYMKKPEPFGTRDEYRAYSMKIILSYLPQYNRQYITERNSNLVAIHFFRNQRDWLKGPIWYFDSTLDRHFRIKVDIINDEVVDFYATDGF